MGWSIFAILGPLYIWISVQRMLGVADAPPWNPSEIPTWLLVTSGCGALTIHVIVGGHILMKYLGKRKGVNQ